MAAVAGIIKGYMTMCDVTWNRRQRIRSCSIWLLALSLSFGYLQSSRAGSALDAFFDNLDSPSAFEDYFRDWFKRVDETQAVQPHWKPPLFGTTSLLTELYKYDQYFEHLSNGAGNLTIFDAGKGLELIPAKSIEVIFGLPPYEERSGRNPASGFGDWPFLLIKDRFLSANEENGNYCLTGFVAFTAPTGSNAFSTKNFGITPSIAAGKGWGNFDVQTSFGINIPTGDFHKLGTPLLINTAFQYRVFKVIWPQVEVNYTYWPNGPNRGKNQVFLLPGVVIGPMPLYNRLTWSVGAGYQFAVTDAHPQYENNLIFDFRVNF
jgi:hypothetical protein